MNAFTALLKRDLRVAIRQPAQVFNPLLFFMLILMLFPFGIGPSNNQLLAIGPGVIWVAALLANLLALDTLFREDADDGCLDYLLLSPTSTLLLVYAKLLAHWLLTALPLILISPLLTLLYGLPSSALTALMLTLLLGTPALSSIGAIGAALTLNIRRHSLLLALIVLPLYIPIVIFATSAVTAAIDGLTYLGQLYLLAAFMVLALCLTPPAIAAALKLSAS